MSSLCKLTHGGELVVQGWYTTSDSGSTTEDSNAAVAGNKPQIAANDSIVYTSYESRADYGRTSRKYICQCFDVTDGSLNWEKMLCDIGDTSHVSQAETKNQVAISKNDTDHVIQGFYEAHSTDYAIAYINASGVLQEIAAPHVSLTGNGWGLAGPYTQANGDIYCVRFGDYNDADDHEICCLDRSATNPYTTSVNEKNVPSVLQEYASGFCAFNDQLVICGSSNAVPIYATIALVNAGASSITYSRNIRFYGDTNDLNRYYNVCADDTYIYAFGYGYDDSAATGKCFLTKFNSTLTEQWTVEFGGNLAFVADKNSMAVSPDGTRLYLMHHANPDTDQTWFCIVDTSDGSVIDDLCIRGSGTTILGAGQIACNSTHVFILFNRRPAGSSYFTGIGLLCLEQKYWDAVQDGTVWDEVEVFANGTYLNSSTDFTLNTNTTGSTSLNNSSMTQGNTSNSELVALDAAHTITTVEV